MGAGHDGQRRGQAPALRGADAVSWGAAAAGTVFSTITSPSRSTVYRSSHSDSSVKSYRLVIFSTPSSQAVRIG